MIYIYTLIPLIVLDAIWLTLMGSHYRTWLSQVFAPSVSVIPIIIFYPLYALGIVFLVLRPAMQSGALWWHVLLMGMFLGLIAYGAYDLTNQATIKDWPWYVTVIDMAWGAVVTGAASGIAVLLSRFVS